MTATVTYLQHALVPQARRELLVESGSIRSLAPMDWQTPYVAFVDGQPVLRADWELVLEDGQALAFVDVNAIPQGGGGGSNPVALVLMIALTVYAPYLAANLYGALGGTFVAANAGFMLGMAQAAVMVVGSALINTLVPPPKPTTAQSAAAIAAASPTYSLQAQGNTGRLEAAIPEHFGRMLAYPDFAAQPYQEFYGNDQFLYHLLCIGRGAYDIEAVRIEDTPIERFDEITMEVVQPGATLSLFPANVVTSVEVSGQTLMGIAGNYAQLGTVIEVYCPDSGLAVGREVYLEFTTGAAISGTYTVVSLPAVDKIGVTATAPLSTNGKCITSPWVGGFIAAESGTMANHIGLDYAAPKGLFRAKDDGTLAPVSLYPYAEFRPVDEVGAPLGPWVGLSAPIYTGATSTPQRYSEYIDVVPGRYEVRARRRDSEFTETRYGHSLVWGGLRSYLLDSRTFGDVTLLAVRMRATNSLSAQSSRKINVIATRKLPVWTGAAWTGLTPTRSPAWAFAYACKQVGLTDAQIDLPTLLTLDATWSARGDTFDARFDAFIGFWEAATKILGAGRAKPYMQAGVMRVKRDQPASIPVALFSMRNIVKGSFSVDYLMPTADTADAIDVAYFDESSWKQQRVRAALPGSTAARPAKVDMFGVVNRAQAHREGLYQAASNRYRRRTVKFSTEMEGFIPSYGDLIAIQHDMPGWGQGGEVVAWSAGTRTLTLSEPPEWGTGTHYIGLRTRDGGVDGPYVVTPGAAANEVILAMAPATTPYTGTDEERTHYAFGWANTWRQRALVLSVRPRDLRTVEIEAVVEDDNVHTADVGVFTPQAPSSQLASYSTAPVLRGLAARYLLNVRNKAIVTWQPSPWANYYVVDVSSDGAVWTSVASPLTSELTIDANYGGDTYVRVAAVGLARGAWEQVVLETPQLPDVRVLTIDGDRLTWPAVQAPNVDGYQIRYHYGANVDWGSAHALQVGLVTASPYVMPVRPPGAVTILIKAVDTVGNESLAAAYVLTDLGDPLVANVLESFDFRAAGWPQEWSNAYLLGGSLHSTQSDPFYKVDAGLFYTLDGADFYSANFDAMTWVSAGWTPSQAAAGSNLTASWDLVGESINVEYRPTGPSPFYGDGLSGFYGADASAFYAAAPEWTAWPGSIVAANQEYQWRVTTRVGAAEGVLSQFVVSVDVPDKTLSLHGVTLAAGGSRLAGAVGQFNTIQNIQLTLQGGSNAVLLEIQDYSPTLGPLITAKNAGGAGVAATVDALLQGY